jgi:maltose alpha-D-glucosyltransferase/alpha-amylase
LRSRPWFQGQLRRLKRVTLRDAFALGPGEEGPRLTLAQAEYDEGEPEVYLIPMAFTPQLGDPSNPSSLPGPAIAHLRVQPPGGGEPYPGLLYDPSGERGFVSILLDLLGRGQPLEGESGTLRGERDRVFSSEPAAELRLLESCNSVVIVGERLLLKLYRRIEEGMQPELEMNRVLYAKTSFTHVPRLLGALQYHSERGEPATVGIIEEYVVAEGDAWRLTLDALHRFFDRILSGAEGPPQIEPGPRSLVELTDQEIPSQAREQLGSYLETSRLIARRTAELHVALAAVKDDPDFEPEPFTGQYQRSLYQSMRSRIRQTMVVLRQRLGGWPPALRELADRVAHGEDKLMRVAHRICDRRIEAPRIRCHGHLHLGHLLYTGKDFLIIDLEGEADRSIPHRRRKRSPTRDLASLHRSLQEAGVAALHQGGVRPEDVPMLEPWVRFWQRWAAVVFLKEYRAVTGTAQLLPRDPASLTALLDFYRLGWNISGLRHELAALSERADMLLRNLIQMMERS